jgi:hypothetical protein
VGDGGAGPALSLPLSRIGTEEFDSVAGSWRARSENSLVRIALPALRDGIAVIRVAYRVLKPVDEPLWQIIATEYERRGNTSALAAARSRTIRYASAAEADQVLARLEWVREGRLLKEGERAF